MITAKVITDSISPKAVRLTTFQLRYPKFIHGELMTHRKFSRNASSSRAVPTSKLLEEVTSDELRAAPVWWGKNEPGMQANAELCDTAKEEARSMWRNAALVAAGNAQAMLRMGVHKQIANRILEPFSHINVVVSATEYMNFFGLRLDRAAQPEMRTLAEAMWASYDSSTPQTLEPGQWHLPYVLPEDVLPCIRCAEENAAPDTPRRLIEIEADNLMRHVSVARCARVSYTSFETGKRSNISEDLALYQRLLGAQPLHASPAEHQATPDVCKDVMGKEEWRHPELWGNFHGWCQYRKMLNGENMAPLPLEYRNV